MCNVKVIDQTVSIGAHGLAPTVAREWGAFEGGAGATADDIVAEDLEGLVHRHDVWRRNLHRFFLAVDEPQRIQLIGEQVEAIPARVGYYTPTAPPTHGVSKEPRTAETVER